MGVKLPAHRAGLPGNVDTIKGSAFLPAYLPTAGRQGGASSRLARGREFIKPTSSLAKEIEPEDLSAYAEDHGLCPWMNA